MASILPQGKTQFFDNSGNPLAGGSVTFYSLGTTTYKNTYQDMALSIPNANPVVLDASGRGVIWGSGAYTMVVNDASGNQIYEADTFDGNLVPLPTTSNELNLIRINSSGNAYESRTPAEVVGDLAVVFYAPTIASLRALTSTTTATTCIVANYATAGDQGGGTFVVDASDTTSADNGGTIIVDAAGRRWYRQFSGPVNVKWFGAKGDQTTVDSQAFINALACVVSMGGGTIYIPNGKYNLTSSFVTSGGQNAIIPLPAVAQNNQNITIRFEGESNVVAYGPPVPTGGVVLFSNTAATTTNGIVPSVIGYGASSLATIVWSAITVEMRNLTVRVGANSGIVPIDLYAVTNSDLENVAVTVDAAPGSIPTPTVQTPGIKLPATGNFGWVKCRKFYSTGFYFGIQHSEHADIEGLINYCISATYIPDSYSHLAKYRITTQECSYSIYVTAQASATFPYCNSIWGELDIERDPQLPFVSDIYVSSGALLNGIINYNVAASPNSSVSTSGSGSAHLILNNIAEPQTAQAIVGYSPSATSTITPLASQTLVLPASLTGAITLTLAAGNETGQMVRVYGNYQYAVTVSPVGTQIYLQNNQAVSSWTMQPGAGSVQFIDLVWSGGTNLFWFAQAVGGFDIFANQVASATTPANFSPQKIITLYDANGGGPYYVPADTAVW